MVSNGEKDNLHIVLFFCILCAIIYAENRNEEEIAGYREVLNTIHENHDYIVPRYNVILQLHRDLYMYNSGPTGGSFKNSDNIIEEKNEFGEKRSS